MNKIVASLGLAAIGASGLQAVAAGDDLGAPASKIWNVSAALRGFYDDNINTTHSGTNKVGSAGFEVAPSIGLAWDGQGTSAKMNYVYSFKYFDKRPAGDQQNYDQTHMFDAELQHSFSSRYHIAVSDSFVVGQEPDALRVPNTPLVANQIIQGNNIRNYGTVVFDAQLTPKFSLNLNYQNSYFDYQDSFSASQNPAGSPVTASSSGLLDRDENNIALEARWLLQPETTGLVGYRFGAINYTGNEPISGFNSPLPPPAPPVGGVMSDARNSYSQYGYVGAIHNFSPDLSGNIRGGMQYIDFYNDPQNNTDISPFILMSMAYTYAPESHADIGFSQTRSPSSTAGFAATGTNFVRDADVSLVYGSITHRIAPRLFGSVIGTFQNSLYNGGSLDGKTEQFYELGLNLKYAFNKYSSAEIGYNFDYDKSYSSSLDYSRNRVYIGLGVNY